MPDNFWRLLRVTSYSLESADLLADNAGAIPLAAFEAVSFDAREKALCAGKIAEWWDEFWHGFALTVARGNVPQNL